MSDKCKEMVYTEVWSGGHQCYNKAKKDGYCGTHHPDAVKARQKKSDDRYEEKRKNSVHSLLKTARERIKELESQLKERQVDKILDNSEIKRLTRMVETLQGEREWVSVATEIPAGDWLFLWRPVDHEERPFHTEIIIGKLAHNSTTHVWANGRTYDIETHITHWMKLPSPPTKEEG